MQHSVGKGNEKKGALFFYSRRRVPLPLKIPLSSIPPYRGPDPMLRFTKSPNCRSPLNCPPLLGIAIKDSYKQQYLIKSVTQYLKTCTDRYCDKGRVVNYQNQEYPRTILLLTVLPYLIRLLNRDQLHPNFQYPHQPSVLALF